MKDRDSKTIFTDVVEMKRRGLEGTVEKSVRSIARLGYKKVILCSDQEPAILDLVERSHCREKGSHDCPTFSGGRIPVQRTG